MEETAHRLISRDVEPPVEGVIGRPDSQALVQDEERLPQGRDDLLVEVEGNLHGPLASPSLSDVAEDQDNPGDDSGRVANRRGIVLDHPFRAVPGEQEGVTRRSNDHAVPQHPAGGTLDWQAALVIDDLENVLQVEAHRFVAPPAGQGLGHGVEQGDEAGRIDGDHRVADGIERDAQPLFLVQQGVVVPALHWRRRLGFDDGRHADFLRSRGNDPLSTARLSRPIRVIWQDILNCQIL